jgi:hypothetical protein
MPRRSVAIHDASVDVAVGGAELGKLARRRPGVGRASARQSLPGDPLHLHDHFSGLEQCDDPVEDDRASGQGVDATLPDQCRDDTDTRNDDFGAVLDQRLGREREAGEQIVGGSLVDEPLVEVDKSFTFISLIPLRA